MQAMYTYFCLSQAHLEAEYPRANRGGLACWSSCNSLSAVFRHVDIHTDFADSMWEL